MVKLNQVTVGAGRSLFEGSFAPERWRLVSTRTPTCRVVPGAGTDRLTGVAGSLDLSIDGDGTHRYVLAYRG